MVQSLSNDLQKARKLTVTKCLACMTTANSQIGLLAGLEVIVDGEIRDRAIWAGDLYASGPSAAKFMPGGKKAWKNSLLAVASKQYLNGKLPACVTLDLKYRPLSPFFDTYSMWWVLSAHDYLRTTKDKQFRQLFVNVFKKLLSYLERRVDRDGLYTTSPINLYWNWTVLRSRKSVLANTLFYKTLLIAKEYNITSPVDLNIFKSAFRKYFWNEKKGLFTELKSKTTFLDGNATALLFGLVSETKKTKFINSLKKFETDKGPVSYIGKAIGVSGWHKDLISPFAAYLYAKALVGNGYRVQAANIMKSTLNAGLSISKACGATTIPEFWKVNGKLPGKPAFGSNSFAKVSLCHAWSTFGKLF